MRDDSTAEEHDDQALPGTLIDGRYRISSMIGEGGMGTVFLAVQEELGRDVAVKILRPEWCSSRRAVERFLREARTVCALGHDNIVDVYDLGRLPDGRPYMAMELLRGRDLGTLLEAEGPQSPTRVAELLAGPADALDTIHARNIVHRDIKPENLVVLRSSGRELVKLVDFGIAALVGSGESRLTATGMICGTPHYMAPEASDADVPDPRVDVYALATVAYELISGQLPFDAPEGMHVLASKLVTDAPLLRKAMSKTASRGFSTAAAHPVPEQVEELLARALSRNPAARPSSASGFVAELKQAAASKSRPLSHANTQEIPLSFDEPLDEPGTANVGDAVEGALDRPPNDRETARWRYSPFQSAISDRPPTEMSRYSLRRRRGGVLIAALAMMIGAVVVTGGVYLGVTSSAPAASSEPPRDPAPNETAGTAPVGDPGPAATRDQGAIDPAPPTEAAVPVVDPPSEAAHERGDVPREPRPRRPRTPTDVVEAASTSPINEVADAPAGTQVSRDQARALTDEGNRLSLAGRFPEAIDRYREAVLRAPRHAAGWRGLGIANERMGRRPEAASAFARYLELAPRASDADRIRARLDALR